MKILFMPNWRVKHLEQDDAHIQSPDKYVDGQPYWFFKPKSVISTAIFVVNFVIA